MIEASSISDHIIDPETYQIRIQKKPREKYPIYKYPKNVKQFIWGFPISLFKDYKNDNEVFFHIIKKGFTEKML